MRNAFSRWYNEKSAKDLAFQMTKYANRDGWTHRDILRLAHTKPTSVDHDALFKMALDKPYEFNDADVQKYIAAVNEIKSETNVKKIVALISDNRLPMEVVPTEARVHAEVWDALLPHMGLTALVRNLATMTRVGLIAPMSNATKTVSEKLLNEEALKKARVHPLDLLVALKTYESGHGFRGTNTWTPVQMVSDVLEKAFYLAFKTITPTGKRFLLGLDVSGSMTFQDMMGVPGLTPRVGAAVMAMVTARSEQMYHMMGFSNSFINLGIKATDSLNDVIRKTDGLPFSSTDCSLPMMYALEKKIPVDTFVVYTDNETFAGRIHPVQALKQYRQKMGIDSKLVVVGMTSTNFTIADPSDMGMLDVVGFDSATPQLISQFSAKGF
jgi:60 kDa SS-A/Ro ribonucleoprotein